MAGVACALLLMFFGSSPKRDAEALMRQNPSDERAAAILREVIATDPKDPEAHYLLGKWALVKGQYELAVQEETRAAQLSPGLLEAQMQAWTIVAVASDMMNQPGETDSAFRKAIALNRRLPHFDPNAAYEYLKFLEREHREQEAGLLTGEILKLSPGFGPAHLSKAKLLAAGNRNPEAALEAEFALAHTKDSRAVERDAHYLLARLYGRMRQPKQLEVHKKWLSENP